MNAIDDVKKARLAIGLKWGLGLAAAVVISPIVFLAVKGLVGLALAATIGLAMVNFAPVLSMKFANWKLRGIKHEARTNPVETLQNQLVDRRKQLSAFRASITEFNAAVKGFEGKVTMFKRQQPDQADRFEKQLKGMQDLLVLRERRYREADAELDKFEGAIERASALWDMSLEAQRMNKLAGQQDAGAFDRIKTDVAFDSVESSLNRAFAELETSLLDEAPALTHSPTDVIEMQPIGVKETTR